MAGSITPRGPQRWELRIGAGPDPSRPGRYLQVSRTFHGSKRQAEKALAALVTEVERGQHKVAAATFGDLLDDWLEHCEMHLSPTTMREYRRLVAVRLKPALGTVPLRKLSARDFDRLYSTLTKDGLSPASVRRVHACARRSLEQAVLWDWLATNPAARAQPPKVHKVEVDPPSIEQLVAIIAKAAEQDRDLAIMLVVAAGLGGRRGELVGLRWRDVDLDAGTVKIHRSVVDVAGRSVEKDTKTHQVRRFPLDPLTVEVLRAHRVQVEARCDEWVPLADDAFVFSREPDGSKPIRPEALTKAFARAAKAAGVEGSHLHDLRHLNASQLVAGGVPITEVARRLGHARNSTTSDIYSHYVGDAGAQAPGVLAGVLGPVVSALIPAAELD